MKVLPEARRFDDAEVARLAAQRISSRSHPPAGNPFHVRLPAEAAGSASVP